MNNLENLLNKQQQLKADIERQKEKAKERQAKLNAQIKEAKKQQREKEKKALTRQKIILGGLYFKFQSLQSGNLYSYEDLINWLDGECKKLEAKLSQEEQYTHNTHDQTQQ